MIGLALLLVIVTVFWLDIYTCNGCSIEVPDFTDISTEQLDEAVPKYELRYEIVDSNYLPDKPPNVVYAQDPSAGTKVKKNRKIYLSVTSNNIPKVKFPSIIYEKGVFEDEYSVKLATSVLKYAGLEVGAITTRPDISTNVLEARIEGDLVKNGQMVPRGSKVDLLVGVKTNTRIFDLPNLRGLTMEEAILSLNEASLNLGDIVYEGEINDSSLALVNKQKPSHLYQGGIRPGEYIQVWMIDYDSFVRDTTESPKSKKFEKLAD